MERGESVGRRRRWRRREGTWNVRFGAIKERKEAVVRRLTLGGRLGGRIQALFPVFVSQAEQHRIRDGVKQQHEDDRNEEGDDAGAICQHYNILRIVLAGSVVEGRTIFGNVEYGDRRHKGNGNGSQDRENPSGSLKCKYGHALTLQQRDGVAPRRTVAFGADRTVDVRHLGEVRQHALEAAYAASAAS